MSNMDQYQKKSVFSVHLPKTEGFDMIDMASYGSTTYRPFSGDSAFGPRSNPCSPHWRETFHFRGQVVFGSTM